MVLLQQAHQQNCTSLPQRHPLLLFRFLIHHPGPVYACFTPQLGPAPLNPLLLSAAALPVQAYS
jgi:hypothetical protein